MNDTSPQMAARMCEMIRQKKGEERLTMGCSMYDCVKQLVTNAILRDNPHLPSWGMRREIFFRMYGRDFNQMQQEKIIKHLTSGPRNVT